MSLTTQQFLNKLQRVQLKIKEDDTPLRLASYSSLAKQAIRIFTEGKNSAGGNIGKYLTKDIWINPDPESGDFAPRNQGGFSPLTGKTGNTEFKTNPDRVRKTSWFQGWKGFREAQGLNVNVVNLEYTGELFFDFCNPRGGVPTTRKVTNTEYVTSLRKELSQKKLAGAEKRFADDVGIGRLTDQERAEFLKVLRFEMRKLIAET